jgi:salicylate hydroxylase
MPSLKHIAVVGGGIGGLSAALALGRTGNALQVYEQASEISETGAGIGLGPNAMRVLQEWGVSQTLLESGCTPQQLIARDTGNGSVIGQLPMGQSFIDSYGAPYLTLHRADLQQVLLSAVKQQSSASLLTCHTLAAVKMSQQGLDLYFQDSIENHQAQVLIGADGLHSAVRSAVFGHHTLMASGHWAYRALLPMSEVPQSLRQMHIGIWMGRRLHVVHYPVRGGDALNLVVLLESHDAASQPGWDVSRSTEQITADLNLAMHKSCTELQDLINAAQGWRAWCLFDREPLQHASQMVQGRVALLGDAAHPMLPYLAQGAGMAIEDAACLAMHWQNKSLTEEQRLLNYAQSRWQRVSRVQQRARRNGNIFHAHGLLKIARDFAMKIGGARLMDMPWLYGTSK